MEDILQTTEAYCQFKVFRNIVHSYFSLNFKIKKIYFILKCCMYLVCIFKCLLTGITEVLIIKFYYFLIIKFI